MRKSHLVVFTALAFSSCNSKFEYRPLSSYKIDHSALKDGDTIKVLYCSGGPDNNEDKQYFYHLVAVNVNKTTDTVNVLVPDISSLSAEEDIKIFISTRNVAYKLLNSTPETENVTHVDDAVPADIKRVVINKENGAPEDTHYPVIIGMLCEEQSSIPDDVKALIPK